LMLVACGACSFRLPGTDGVTVDDAPLASDGPGSGSGDGSGGGAFDPARDCPAGYGVMVASTSATSRYRVIDTADTAWVGYAACEADGHHALSIGSMTELTEITTAVATALQTRFYIGGVQDPKATAPGMAWINFDGTTLLDTAWYTPEAEPNDLDDGDETDHEQQLAIIDRISLYLHDAVGNTVYGTICECDGKAISAKARTFVDADPNKP